MSSHWTLEGFDTFSRDSYPLGGKYPTEEAARQAAEARLAALEVTQPTSSSGGQEGIQDRVYLVAPDGSKTRYLPSPKNDDAIEEAARAFAQERHAAQKYGDSPYGVHLSAVREVLRSMGHGGPLGVAAWLHDVVEDTPTTREEVGARFGDEVAALVWAVSGVGKNRKERNACAYAKIRATPAAAVLKLADRIANVEASRGRPDKLAMYREEWPSFEAALAGLGDERMWARLRTALGL